MDGKEFENRTALVTGGSRGIGRAICKRLAQSQARIAINYVANRAAAEETRAIVVKSGAECEIYQANVSDRAQNDAMFDNIERDLGPVDLLVTNAGIARSGDKTDMSDDIWHEIMTVNVDGTFYPVWRAKDKMAERGFGRIVCVSSINGLVPNMISHGRLIAYGTSKAAVIGFVRNCAKALGPDIRVNCVAPGLIETDMTADVTEAARRQINAATPLNRAGQPEEIAELVHFLLSERASFTTGQTYVASGGLVMLP